MAAPVRNLIDLQLVTGARPGELLKLRPCDIDRSREDVWFAVIDDNKMVHKDQTRIVFFGPQAQKVLRPVILARKADEYLFSPREAFIEAMKKRRQEEDGGRRENQKPNPKKTDRQIGDCFTTHSYRRAIDNACKKSDINSWHPHQLRHNAATLLERTYGAEAAQVVLGHESMDTTKRHYIEKNLRLAMEVVSQFG